MKNLKNNTSCVGADQVNAKMLYLLSRMLIIGVCLMLVLLIGFQSCNNAKSLEGTYVNSAGSEFSIAHDTLIVEQEEGSRYVLHRTTGFQLLDDAGRAGKPEHEKEEWIAVLDTESGIMRESRKGKQISFSADGETMTVGKRKYTRILTE